MERFPYHLLTPSLLRWRPASSFITGPSSIFGEAQRRNPRPGWRWVAEFGNIHVKNNHGLLEAVLLKWRLGGELMLVPRIAGPQRPTLDGDGVILTPHSDETPFSDDSLYGQTSISAELVDSIALGATTARISVTGARALTGGEPFEMIGPVYLNRLYSVIRILEAPEDGPDGEYTVLFGPNAREALPAGTAVNFADPHCVMRPVFDDSMWPTYSPGFFGAVNLTFEETFNMSDGGDV